MHQPTKSPVSPYWLVLLIATVTLAVTAMFNGNLIVGGLLFLAIPAVAAGPELLGKEGDR